MSGANILFIVTGSIAGYKACEVISQLVQQGHKVRPVATASAQRFVGLATLEGLTGEPVRTDLFAPGAALEHIELTRWADLVIVCPATAHTLNRLAAGLADDLAGALFLAHDRTKPFLIAPAMNPAMWAHPATVSAVARLRDWGVEFVPVASGRTACGEWGEGRLAEPSAIVAAVAARLAGPRRRLKVLVTSGATAEPIDGVRVLTNRSTGRTGAGIATHFARAGHEVILLRASHSAPAGAPCREEEFGSFAELDAALGRLLQAEAFDVVIHAAAVGDFGIESVVVAGVEQPITGTKLASSAVPTLRLRPQPKLVDGLRARSVNPGLQVVAFKLTHGATAETARRAVTDLQAHSGADFVVHNDLAARTGREAFPADIYRPNGRPAAHCATRAEIGPALEALLCAGPAAETISTPHHHAALP
jgi:phosphopantothenoylcysteine decarboxylase/phosphopantothenate--cysteine ligase